MDASNPQHSLFLSLSLAVSFCVCLFHNIFERIFTNKMWVTFLVSELVMNIGWHKRNQIKLYGNGTTIFTTNHSKQTFIAQNCSYFFGNSVIVSFALYSVSFSSFCQFVLVFYSTLFIFLSLIFNHFFFCIFFYFVLLLGLMEISHFYFGWNTHKKCWDCETQARVQHSKIFLDLQRVIFV